MPNYTMKTENTILCEICGEANHPSQFDPRFKKRGEQGRVCKPCAAVIDADYAGATEITPDDIAKIKTKRGK